MAQYVSYLTLQDYLPIIQEAHLLELLTNDIKRQNAENFALNLVRSHLSARFDLDAEFTPTLPYDNTVTYGAGARVTYDYDEWVSGNTYDTDSFVALDGVAYQCAVANNDSTFDADKWNVIGQTSDIFYIPYPYPKFQLSITSQVNSTFPGYYKVGDKVWYNDHIYTCLRPTQVISQDSATQYQSYKSIPPANVFPDAEDGALYWFDEGEYTVEAGTLPNSGVWVKGDNRDAMILAAVISITLYRACYSAAPNAVPEARAMDYKETMCRIEAIRIGDMTTDIDAKQPEQSSGVWWTSRPKTRNSYGY